MRGGRASLGHERSFAASRELAVHYDGPCGALAKTRRREGRRATQSTAPEHPGRGQCFLGGAVRQDAQAGRASDFGCSILRGFAPSRELAAPEGDGAHLAAQNAVTAGRGQCFFGRARCGRWNGGDGATRCAGWSVRGGRASLGHERSFAASRELLCAMTAHAGPLTKTRRTARYSINRPRRGQCSFPRKRTSAGRGQCIFGGARCGNWESAPEGNRRKGSVLFRPRKMWQMEWRGWCEKIRGTGRAGRASELRPAILRGFAPSRELAAPVREGVRAFLAAQDAVSGKATRKRVSAFSAAHAGSAGRGQGISGGARCGDWESDPEEGQRLFGGARCGRWKGGDGAKRYAGRDVRGGRELGLQCPSRLRVSSVSAATAHVGFSRRCDGPLRQHALSSLTLDSPGGSVLSNTKNSALSAPRRSA